MRDVMTLENAEWTQTYSSSSCSNTIYDCFDDVESEARTILDGTTIFICTFVAYILEELVDQVPIRASPWVKDGEKARKQKSYPWISTPSKPAFNTAFSAAWAYKPAYSLISSTASSRGTAPFFSGRGEGEEET